MAFGIPKHLCRRPDVREGGFMVLPARLRIPRGLMAILVALLLAVALVPMSTARAATDPLFVTATGHYVRGVFRDFWDKNGGLANFGYPITDEYVYRSGRVFQYFERARFERDRPESTAVLLGQLGRERTADRTFATATPISNTASRRYFSETRQIVQYGFKQIWETRGGLAIFGLPLSSELQEQADDGKTRTVQYFERVRFEYHPELPDGQRVLISLLGRALAPAALTAPLAPGAPIPPLVPAGTPPAATPPTLVRPLVPDSKNAVVYPHAGKAGDMFLFTANGFNAGERVAVWANAPDGSVLGIDEQFTADAQGTIDDSRLFLRTNASFPTGTWSMVAQGVKSGKTAVAYFLLVSSPLANADVSRRVVVEPPPDVDARADPKTGPVGTVYFFDARGFRTGEEVTVVVTAADGSTTNSVVGVKADSNGAIGYAGLYYASAITSPIGVYSMTATGKDSGKRSIAYFVVYPG
jgi:hypothetical protein